MEAGPIVATQVIITTIQGMGPINGNGHVEKQRIAHRGKLDVMVINPFVREQVNILTSRSVRMVSVEHVLKMGNVGNDQTLESNVLVAGVNIPVVRAVHPLMKKDLFRLTINGICLESLPYYTDQDGSVKAPVKPYQIPVSIFQENAIPTTMRIRKNVLVVTGKWMA